MENEQWLDDAIKNAVDVHISEIRPGDTILCSDGNVRTVGRNNIKESDGFMGVTLFGDSYRSGAVLIKKLLLRQ